MRLNETKKAIFKLHIILRVKNIQLMVIKITYDIFSVL